MSRDEASISGLQAWLTATLGATGIGAAAFGAHGLEEFAAPEGIRWWAIGAAIQLVTCPVLLTLPVLERRGRGHRAAYWLLVAGLLLFSGSLYAMTLGAPRQMGAVTPLGGVLLVAGWLASALPRR